jgi:competence protein ComEC
MRVEREIAGFAFPFAAGVMAAVLSGGSPCIIKPTYHTISLAMTLLPVIMLLHHDRRSWDPRVQWGLIVICALSCGIFIGISGAELQVSVVQAEGWLSAAAEKAGRGMGALIDSMAFDDSQTNGIIKALLTGDRTRISSETAEGFRSSGASHILALSGLHLGIIYGMIHFMTRGLGNSKPSQAIRSSSLVSICGFYMLATGAGASIVRAFIFIVIGECIRLSGRQSILKNTTMTALIIHLAIMPSAIKEVGFQLSYAAIFGIAFIFPWMQGFWPGDRHEDGRFTRCTRWIWDSAAMSISCQITTAPLAYMYFGTFPTQFILTNLIALPLTGIIIPCSLTTLTASMLGWHPQILLDITEWMISLLCGSLDLLSTM